MLFCIGVLPNIELFRLLSGIGSAIIRLVFGRGGRRGLPPVESAGNDIVRELMGIA